MKIIVKNLQRKISVKPAEIKKVIFKALRFEKINRSGEISVLLVNDQKIKRLNLAYLGKNSPTDVISFDNSINKNKIFADIVISVDTASRNARIFRTTPLYELYLYVVHGLLHILGYDDKRKKDRLDMHKKQEYLLKILNLLPIT